MSGKKSSIIYHDLLSVVDQMPDEMAGKFVKYLLCLMQNKEVSVDDFSLKIALHPFISQFKRDNEKYENICERNRANGLMGGRPKTKENPKNPSGLYKTQENPKNHDTDTDTDTDTGNDIKKNRRFTPPELSEVKDYCLKRNKNVDPERWYDFYQAKNWMIGKNKMKDWKAAVRTWENNDNGAGKNGSGRRVGFIEARKSGETDWLGG